MQTGKFLGVVSSTMTFEMINEITTDRTGLGETGEIYLINRHGYMITPARFKKDSFLSTKVDNENVRQCFEDYKIFGAKPHEHFPFTTP